MADQRLRMLTVMHLPVRYIKFHTLLPVMHLAARYIQFRTLLPVMDLWEGSSTEHRIHLLMITSLDLAASPVHPGDASHYPPPGLHSYRRS